MKKFNWGYGIGIFLVCFISMLVFVLLESRKVNHSLVTENYYAQDLAYQKRYDKEKRQLQADNVTVNYNKDQQSVTIKFENNPKEFSGGVTFYRPSDAARDLILPINKREEIIDVGMLPSGKWILILDWSEDGVAYYKREALYI